MSQAAYRESWKIAKENRSSQGPHIVMYKAAAQHPLLRLIFHKNYDIPYLSGYSIRRHHIGTDAVLPKKADSWDVKDLCTTFLLESEANHTYKRIGREAMQSAIEHRQIAPEQYSRPQRSAVAHRINGVLVFDYQRYLLKPLSLACSDLKICYDRISTQPSA